MAQRESDLTPHLSLDHFVGSELRRLRRASDLSHCQLASRAYVSASLIARIERGERRLTDHLAEDIDVVLSTGGALRQLVEARCAQSQAPTVRRSGGVDPIEGLNAVITRGNDGGPGALYSRSLERIKSYPEHAPDALWWATQQDLGTAEAMLRSTPTLHEHETLLRSVAVLTGTAGNILMDLGDLFNGRRYFDLSRQAGQELADHALIAWTLGMQGVDMIVARSWLDAAALLDHACELASSGPVRRVAWLNAMRARAYAGLSEAKVALNGLDAAREWLGKADSATHLDFFDYARLEGAIGTINLLLHNVEPAEAAISSAIAQRRREDVKGVVLHMLDHADCAIIAGDPNTAGERILAAVTFGRSQLVEPVKIRLRELRAKAAQWAGTAAIREVDSTLGDLLVRPGKA